MPIYKMTHFFTLYSQGWSESHYVSNGTVNAPISLFPDAVTLAQLRAAFLGYPAQIIGFRISAYRQQANGVVLPRAAKSVRGLWTIGSTAKASEADPADVCINLVGDTTLGVGNTNLTQLGAPLDLYTVTGGILNQIGTLQTTLAAYTAFLKGTSQLGSTFGWLLSQSQALNPLVTSITQNVNGTVEFVMAGATFGPGVTPAGPAFGVPFKVRVSRVNGGKSVLNRVLTLVATNATTANSIERVAFFTGATGGQIRAYANYQPFTPYVQLNAENFVGNHRRGRPFFSVRGRAPAKALG